MTLKAKGQYMRYPILFTVTLSLLAGCANQNTGADAADGPERNGSASSFTDLFYLGETRANKRKADKAAIDPRGLIPFIRSARADRTLNGHVIRVEGTVERAGYFDLELVARNDGEPDDTGTLTYDFRAAPPQFAQAAPTERSKAVQAAVFVPKDIYADARRIVVVSTQNTVTVSK